MKKILTLTCTFAALLWGCKEAEDGGGGLPKLKLLIDPQPTMIEFQPEATESYAFQVESSVKHWAVELVEPAEWVKIVYTETGFVVTCDVLDVIDGRSTAMQIVSDDFIEGYPDPITIEIVQFGTTPELIVAPATSLIEFPAAAGTQHTNYVFDVATNCPTWDATSNESWCVVTKSATGFTVTAADWDEITAPNDATITVTVNGLAADVFITATQAAAAPRFAVTPDIHAREFSAAATETFTYTVSTNLPASSWSVNSSEPSWCTATKTATGFTITAAENTTPTAPPAAVVTCSATGFADFVIDVTQLALVQYKYTVSYNNGTPTEYIILSAEITTRTDGRKVITLFTSENPFSPYQLSITIPAASIGTEFNLSSAYSNIFLDLSEGIWNTYEMDGTYDLTTGKVKVTDKGSGAYAVDFTDVVFFNKRKVQCHWEGTPDVVTYNSAIPLLPVEGNVAWAAPGYNLTGGYVACYGFDWTGTVSMGSFDYYFPNSTITTEAIFDFFWTTATTGQMPAPRSYTYSNSAYTDGRFGYSSSSATLIYYKVGSAAAVQSYLRTSGTTSTVTSLGIDTGGAGRANFVLRATNNTGNTVTTTNLACTPAYIASFNPAPGASPSAARQKAFEIAARRNAPRDAFGYTTPEAIRRQMQDGIGRQIERPAKTN